uniref:SJCHGC02244 protein n=1 Tax=Schistosoma japonicum TaxID=6182 RepID=Q5BT91_SCHJA|nr:SJCHGC02244 protein [Schistosoma japonicum]
MSKVSFRARQIDFNKPLPILKHGSELFLEISENALVNRGVPQIPSGMEKEEENVIMFRLLCNITMEFRS